MRYLTHTKFTPAMKFSLASALVICTATQAWAGGVERTTQSSAILFEDDTYVEFSLGIANPSVSGSVGPLQSGDIAPRQTNVSASARWDVAPDISAAVIFDQPYGADVEYPTSTYPLTGSTAVLRSNAITALGAYDLGDGFTLFGGAKAQSLSMDVALPATPYTAKGDETWEMGYVVGAAYERPDIALRLALTYHSAIDYALPTTENGATSLDTAVTTPEAVNLEFQTGVAPDTLVFASARWVDWESFKVSPAGYAAGNPAAPNLVSYDNASRSFTLGVGRRFSDVWSAAATLGFEPSSDGRQSNLGPVNGNRSIGLGVTYTRGNMKLSAGARYVLLGDAVTALPGPALTDFSDNDAIAFGLRLGFSL